ncbi:MAG: peptidylprolyl isomerase [Thermoplasmata archaeon]|nr:peptidylprolyl isomerase [Thermoplasmata archaeon]
MESKDVIRLEYELWAKETSELVDTTKEEVAQDEGRFDPDVKYEPMPTIVDAGKLLPLMDKDLLKAKVGKEREVEIPAEEAYGKRDPKQVELHSIHEILRLPEFKKKDEVPQVGMDITLKGKKGMIISMTSGRVRVDFNHPMAGKTLVYKYKVVSKADTPEDKVAWIIEANYAKGGDFKTEVKKDEAEIILPDVCKYDDGWFLSKYRVVSDLRDVLSLTSIRFVEEYVKKEEEKDGEGEKEEGKEKRSGKGEKEEKKKSEGGKKEKETKEDTKGKEKEAKGKDTKGKGDVKNKEEEKAKPEKKDAKKKGAKKEEKEEKPSSSAKKSKSSKSFKD